MSINIEKNSAVSEEGHVLTAYGFYLVVSLASVAKRKNSVKKNRPNREKQRYKETESSVAGSQIRFTCTCKKLLDHCTTVTHMI